MPRLQKIDPPLAHRDRWIENGAFLIAPKLVAAVLVDREIEVAADLFRARPRRLVIPLLGAMEAAGKWVDDDTMREALKERGIIA